MGLLGTTHGWWGSKTLPDCPTYPTMMKLSTVIPYLKKIQKKNKSRGTHPEFLYPDVSSFAKSAISVTSVISRNTVTDCIFVNNF